MLIRRENQFPAFKSIGLSRITVSFVVIYTILLSGCSGGNSDQKEKSKDSTRHVTEGKKETVPVTINKKSIVFFGNSLTAGYGLDNPDLAFPGLIRKKIDSLQLPYTVTNAGLSGETTAGGLGRIDWILREPVDIFILELGGNDGLRGIPVTETSKNLQSIINKVGQKYPDCIIILAGMLVPPNMGNRYATDFRSAFRKLAKKNKIRLIPFLLEGVGGEPDLNQADGIHPNIEGHRIVATNVWKVLRPLL